MANDIVQVKNGPSLMAGDPHGYYLGGSRSYQVSGCCSPKVVEIFLPQSLNHDVKDPLSALLRQLNHDFVFTEEGHSLTQNFRNSLRTTCKYADIPFGSDEPGGFVFHDIRSTVKTNMHRAGLDKAMRDVILGHSLKGMDAYYLKPTDEDLTAAMKRYTVWLDEQLTGAKRENAYFG